MQVKIGIKKSGVFQHCAGEFKVAMKPGQR